MDVELTERGASSSAPPAASTSTSGDAASPPSTPIPEIRTTQYDDDDEHSDDEAALLADTHPNKRRGRSDSVVSLAFDFADRIHLASSADVGLGTVKTNGPPAEPISILGGIALIVGMQIGSGIFSSPGVVAKETGSVGSALLLWTGAGLLSWAAYGPLPAYCFSFTAVTSLKPGGQAIIAVILGEFMSRIFYHTAFSSDPSKAAHAVPIAIVKLTGFVALALISGVHCWSAKAGTRTQMVLTIFKVLAIILVFIGGLVYLGLGKAASDFSFKDSSSYPAGYALALFSALWTFDGWDQANYVSKDCKPGALPRLIVAASEQRFLPTLFSKYHEKQKTPINAILLSSSLSGLFILFGDFAKLTLFYGVIAWTWNLLVVIGLLVLRVREPSLKRPYRTFLATPILFCSTALGVLVLSFFSKPWESFAAFVFCLAGAVPYYFQTRRQEMEERRATEALQMT
ncbi:solute carrier family 7 (L-type amino acid transporter) [Pseudohyphozyma bogoriensis]|nr:solute carrier family 7 (L-type amino acid transporter) [Pseudohyphozyma bogoriensis]